MLIFMVVNLNYFATQTQI